MALSNRLRHLYQHLSANTPAGGVAACRLYSQLALTNKGLAVSSGSHGTTSNMTATVFGCSSFLGRYVVNNLARTGSQVVCPFRCDELDVQHLKVMGVLGQVVLYPDFNLRDDEMLDHAISKSNVVVNLVGAWRETWNYSFHDVHVDLTRRIAEAVKRAGHVERYLHVSCLAASPDAPSERLRTKAEGDRIVRDLLPNATIFKTAHMVGIEDKFTNALAARGKRSPFVGLVDGGHNKIQPVYVRDVARALTDSLKTYDAVGQTYHVAGPEVLTFREFARVVFETMREPYSPFELPFPIAKAAGQVVDYVQKRTPPLPLITPMAFSDFAAEMTVDHVVPAGDDVLTLDDLNVIPAPCTSGSAIEHIRHLRAGGYDMGTTLAESDAVGGLDKRG